MTAEPTSSTAPSRPWVVLIWVILATLGLLLTTEFARTAPCWAFLPLVPVLAYPLWLSLRESFLFSRRVMLSGATREDSLARHMLWSGQISAILRVPVALGLAGVLLASTLRLNAMQWGILFGDTLLFSLLYHVVQRRAAPHVNREMLGVFVRGWPLRWDNLVLLSLAFFTLSFFVQGAPDLRQESWQLVSEQAFQDGRQDITCSWMGWLVGGLDAWEQGSWALAQRVIPGLPHLEERLAAWLLFLLPAGLLALVFTRLLLGVLVLVESRSLRAESETGENTLATTFFLTILVLALVFLYPALRLRDLDPSQFEMSTQVVLTTLDPCRAAPAQNAATQAAVDSGLNDQRDRLNEESAKRITQEVDQLFAPVEAAVDDYLDWYFTVVGEYERLAALATGDFPELMKEQLDTHLFSATDFHTREQTLEQSLLDDALSQLSGLSQAVKEQIETQAGADPCTRAALNWAPLNQLRRDVWREGVAGTTGAVAGVTTVALSKKVAATLVAKVGAKKSVQAAAATGAKLAAKKGGGALAAAAGATAVCAPSGPWAVVCGLTAGVVTWLTVDKIAIEIDEAVSREDMRAEILAVVAEEKDALKSALQARHAALIGQQIEAMRTTVDGVFIPARDGL